jgi:hypothetical protein
VLPLPDVIAFLTGLLRSVLGPGLEVVRNRVTGREGGTGIVPSAFETWEEDSGGVETLVGPVLLVLAWIVSGVPGRYGLSKV